MSKSFIEFQPLTRNGLLAIEALATTPKPPGSKKLVNQPGWRISVGDYRVLYEILENEKIIRVFKAGHRRQIYR